MKTSRRSLAPAVDFDDLDSSLNEQEEEEKARFRRKSFLVSEASVQPPPIQIKEHLSCCLRLAAENKINSKNAFELRLLDYIADLVKKGEKGDFQTLSASLDAGAKIYAGRVDAVHEATYKLLSDLGRYGKEDPSAPAGSDHDDEEMPAQDATKRPKKRSQLRKAVLCKNMAKIRAKSDVGRFDVDPLFVHLAAVYDEGGSFHLRLNETEVASDLCELIIDADTPLFKPDFPDPQEVPEGVVNNAHQPVDPPTEALYALTGQPLCPLFDGFKLSDLDSSPIISRLSSFRSNADESAPEQGIISDDDDAGPTDFPIEEFEEVGASGQNQADPSLREIQNTSNLPDEPPLPPDLTDRSQLLVDSLKAKIFETTEMYGMDQVNDVIGLWAGPEQWRKKARPLTSKRAAGAGAIKGARAARSKRDAISYDRLVATAGEDQELIADSMRTRSGRLVRRDWAKEELKMIGKDANARLLLTKKTVEKNEEDFHMLPRPCQEEETRITSFDLVTMNQAGLGRTQKGPQGPIPSVQVGDYDYKNLADVEGYCPDVAGAGAQNGPPDSYGAVDDDDGDMGGFDQPAFPCVFTQEPDEANAMELDLVEQPASVHQIKIDYARNAKVINMRMVKQCMWDMMSHLPTQPEPVSAPEPSKTPQTNDSIAASDDSAVSLRFSQLVTSVPTQVDTNTAKQLSVAILFNCLLHLANEKQLFLRPQDDLKDVMVMRFLDKDIVDQVAHFRSKSRPLPNKRQTLIEDWMDD